MLHLKNEFVKEIKQAPLKRKKQKDNKLLYAVITGVLLGVGIMVAINWFNYNYKLQSPVIFRSPIIPIEHSQNRSVINSKTRKVPSATPMPLKKSQGIINKVYAQETTDKPEEALHAEIYAKVQMLESSGGKEVGLNAYCIRQGKWNSIGYSPSTKYCFDSQWQEKKVFGLWMQNKYEKGYETSEALCFWNTGIRQNDCHYYKLYQSI
jgi:hypothetical protein